MTAMSPDGHRDPLLLIDPDEWQRGEQPLAVWLAVVQPWLVGDDRLVEEEHPDGDLVVGDVALLDQQRVASLDLELVMPISLVAPPTGQCMPRGQRPRRCRRGCSC